MRILHDTWSSDLHACHVYPWLAARVITRALMDFPIRLAQAFEPVERPDVSFIIPHRGLDRLPLLVATIWSIAAQRSAKVECIVVEQNHVRQIGDLPAGVRYIHLPHPEDPQGWHKSWAYNEGAKLARADTLVFHDGDILVPEDYAAEILGMFSDRRLDVLHLQRFLFCLNRKDSEHLLEQQRVPQGCSPERVRQNWQGGTLVIREEAFRKIGGYDERFVGWGGEDNEFYDRCLALDGWRYGYLPFIHLWHPPQTEKSSDDSRQQAFSLVEQLLNTDRESRIEALRRTREEQ